MIHISHGQQFQTLKYLKDEAKLTDQFHGLFQNGNTIQERKLKKDFTVFEIHFVHIRALLL